MTELETLQRAKRYIDDMANGINPITGETAGDNDTLNNVRVCRCLMYVSEVLEKVIAHGGTDFKRSTSSSSPKAYTITPEQAAMIEITDEAVGISEFSKRIAAVLGEDVKSPSGVVLAKWLEQHGYLVFCELDGSRGRVPTPEGEALGIYTVEGTNLEGRVYKKVMYPRSAQKWIVDNLPHLQSDREKSE